VLVLIALILGNLVILNIFLINNLNKEKENIPSNVLSEGKSNNLEQTSSPNAANSFCPASCIDKISEVSLSLDALSQTQKNTQTGGAATTFSSQKEYFISLGSGSSQAKDWTDVPGAEAIVDGSAYGNIKQVTFQASLYTPTGNQTAYARLYNVTDKHPVWNSDVSIEGGTPQLLISSPITLENSAKKYQVQMKTQLSAITNLVQSRIYIQLY